VSWATTSSLNIARAAHGASGTIDQALAFGGKTKYDSYPYIIATTEEFNGIV